MLGEALAAESGTPYPDLVRERILDPLGMDDTLVHAGVPEGGAAPHIEPGAPSHPWHNTAYAPAGITTWSTTPDLTRLLSAVTSGTAPGMGALEPLREDVRYPGATAEAETGLDGFDVGLAWHIAPVPGVGEVTMHSGGSLGTSTMVAFDDSHGVVVMANSMSLDAVGLSYELLKDRPEPLVPVMPGWAMIAQTLVMAVLPPLLLVSLMLRRRTLVAQRRLDRLRIVSLSAGALAWLAAAQRMGSWAQTPMVVWAVAAGLVAAGITVGVWHWRRVPVEAGRFRWLHVPVFALSVLFSLTLAFVALWGLAGSSF
ncbi:serine hydrolase domain-containing protein [Nocardiopsis sp. Huas11]|uniref:serine hydrolase n=1 Tax=Nocardiopsis sp. Huas11 TaxID=2183912 RepID=UPI0021045932|nr:serine hydrolase domain-containing protein [Nocardiopsis sp. Huas11]